ncbi:MAG: polysaccharide biosynthesis/export family protein [Pontixanthobacter sp.]
MPRFHHFLSVATTAMLAAMFVPTSALAQDTATTVAAEPDAIAPPEAPRTTPYRVNAGDEIQVYVWGEERLQRAVKVLPDGTFAFPLVGRVVAEGRLPGEIEAAITAGLRDQYRGEVPQVTVSVVSPSGLQFSVMGRVAGPGTFTPGRYVNVLEALSMAGGPTEFAKLNSIIIIRKNGEDVQTFRVQLEPLLEARAGAEAYARTVNLRIEPGDTVIVP